MPSALEDLLKRRQAQNSQIQALGQQGNAAQTPLSPMAGVQQKGNRLVSGLIGGGRGALGSAQAFAGSLAQSAPPDLAKGTFSSLPEGLSTGKAFEGATGKSILAPAQAQPGTAERLADALGAGFKASPIGQTAQAIGQVGSLAGQGIDAGGKAVGSAATTAGTAGLEAIKSALAFIGLSSSRFKHSVSTYRQVGDLRWVNFTYLPSLDPDQQPRIGLIAEEVVPNHPDLGWYAEDGTLLGLYYGKLRDDQWPGA